jgi:hypothetical protein
MLLPRVMPPYFDRRMKRACQSYPPQAAPPAPRAPLDHTAITKVLAFYIHGSHT